MASVQKHAATSTISGVSFEAGNESGGLLFGGQDTLLDIHGAPFWDCRNTVSDLDHSLVMLAVRRELSHVLV
jgi:hypothetical protein